MTIEVGQKLPETTFRQMTADGPKPVTTAEVFGGRKVVLFAVPGAYTPTCHRNHLPGFLQNADAIVCVSVNDPFVMGAWAKDTGAEGKIVFLADGSADFAKALGLDLDASANGLGIRSKRYSMIVEDGVVKSLNVEDAPGKAEISGAVALIGQL
jgi:peroxiredoxin